MVNQVLSFVVRTDLPTGRAVAQVAHAMDQWCMEYGTWGDYVHVYGLAKRDFRRWIEHSAEMAQGRRSVQWKEPDLGNQITAIAIEGELQLPLYRGSCS